MESKQKNANIQTTETQAEDTLGCPILVASLQNYTQCIKELYKYGYKIAFPEEDKKLVENVLNMKDALANDIHFYFSFIFGKKNINEVEALSKTFGRENFYKR